MAKASQQAPHRSGDSPFSPKSLDEKYPGSCLFKVLRPI
jgi:hypothetical protein